MKQIQCVFYFCEQDYFKYSCCDRKNKQCSYHQSKNKNKQGNMAQAKHTYMSL